ncbi:hypothetical protein [Effusibacillus consociatus]|uniref:Aminodeoxychorismate lyase n=1 Tax=Effusibacillus consociatus TaxID=1117041 RepID=A0ABV9Q844_9BACL
MIQNRNFLLGLGTGLIAASILFGVSDLVSSKDTLPVSDSSLTGGNPPQTNQHPLAAATPNQEAPKTSDKVKILITEGMTAAEIAELLVKKGVVTDSNAFLEAAKDKTNQIRIGTYDLPVKGDYGQILQILTSGKAP